MVKTLRRISALLVGLACCTSYVFIKRISLQERSFDASANPNELEKRKLEWKSYSKSVPNGTHKKRLPDIVGIGVKKCGTDAVISFLSLHPLIKLPSPVAELFFFNTHKYSKGLEFYKEKCPNVSDTQFIMEKTPSYFDGPPESIPNRIKKDLPNVKLILVLCDPVKRSFSDYTHERVRFEISKLNRMVAKFETFQAFLDEYLDKAEQFVDSYNEKGDIFRYGDDTLTIFTRGFYSLYLPRWMNLFDSNQLLILNGEDLLNDPGKQVEIMQEFIGLPKLIKAEDFVRNPTTGLYCVREWWEDYDFKAEKDNIPGWEKNLRCLGKSKGRTRHSKGKMEISEESLKRLNDLYRPFNEELYQMTNIDFRKKT